MGSPNGSNDTTQTPPLLSFYNTFKQSENFKFGPGIKNEGIESFSTKTARVFF
jgi:hypothetical protein